MSFLIAASLVWLTPPASSESPAPRTSATSSAPAARTIPEWRTAVSTVLKETASHTRAEPADVVPQLVALYQELKTENRLVPSERQALLSKLRSRLWQLESQLVRRLKRAEQTHKTASKSTAPIADTVRVPVDRQVGVTVLAQQFGGASQPGAAAGPAAAPRGGWELVELIHNTIAPESWDVNGGKGSVSFYSPLNVLVVRQSEAVHDELADVLGQLRR
jgi:hypothetical protein